MVQKLGFGAPPGSIVEVSETSYSELFVKWLEHVIATVQASKERSALLLLDKNKKVTLSPWLHHNTLPKLFNTYGKLTEEQRLFTRLKVVSDILEGNL